MQGEDSLESWTEQPDVRNKFRRHVAFAAELSDRGEGEANALWREAFEVAQLAGATSVGRAVARMAERFGTGDDGLALSLRRQQDLVLEWRQLNRALIATYSLPLRERDGASISWLRARIDEIGRDIDAVEARLTSEYPAYKELTNPTPLDPPAVQELLAEDEAMLVYTAATNHTYLWALRRNVFSQFTIEPGSKQLTDSVTALRRTLDPSNNEELVEPFPVQQAYGLFRQIVEPAMPKLAGAKVLYIVPDGPLKSLPFSVLVTAAPPNIVSPLDYQDVPWLARSFATSTLPAVSSFRALRTFAKRSLARNPFVGFGDPVLDGQTGTLGKVRSGVLLRGKLANVDEVRMLSPLPESVIELNRIADALGADPSSVNVGEQASETKVKSVALNQYRLIAFATHGLVAGNLGMAEPALVLTPPKTASELDDGLLTASEVAKLLLDSDWVVLSACNTAAPDGSPDAEGLSGLAKSFFFAGARSILVSHWPVETRAAVVLTTGAIAALSAHPEIGRAEALRYAEMDLLDNPPGEIFAHPAIWSPFDLVGEGAR